LEKKEQIFQNNIIIIIITLKLLLLSSSLLLLLSRPTVGSTQPSTQWIQAAISGEGGKAAGA
jgi:hypothetical protein